MPALQIQEAGHRGAQAESLGVGVVDAGQERLRQTVEGLPPEAPPHEGGEAFVRDVGPAWQDEIAGGAQLAPQAEDPGRGERQQAARSEKLVAFRDRPQRSARVHEGSAKRRVRADDLIRETGSPAEIDPPRLVGNEAVGSSFDDAAIHVVGRDHSAGAGRGLEHRQFEGDAAIAGLGQEAMGAGEPADAGAGDDHPDPAHPPVTLSRTTRASMRMKEGWSPGVPARKKPIPSPSAVLRAAMSRS